MYELTLILPVEWSETTLQLLTAFPRLQHAGLPVESERVCCYIDERSQITIFKNPRS